MGYRFVPRNAARFRQRGLGEGDGARPLHRQSRSFVCVEAGEYPRGRGLQGLCARTHFAGGQPSLETLADGRQTSEPISVVSSNILSHSRR